MTVTPNGLASRHWQSPCSSKAVSRTPGTPHIFRWYGHGAGVEGHPARKHHHPTSPLPSLPPASHLLPPVFPFLSHRRAAAVPEAMPRPQPSCSELWLTSFQIRLLCAIFHRIRRDSAGPRRLHHRKPLQGRRWSRPRRGRLASPSRSRASPPRLSIFSSFVSVAHLPPPCRRLMRCLSAASPPLPVMAAACTKNET